MKFRNLKLFLVFVISLFLCSVTGTVDAANKKPSKVIVTSKKRAKNARLFAEANLAKNTGRYKQAESLYLECLKYDPKDDASMYELGSIYLSSQRINDAKKYALQAYNIDSENNYYSILLSNIYQAEGNFTGSIELLKKLVKKYPNKSDYLRQLAYTYVVAQRYEEAIQLLDQLEKKTGINEMISLQKQQLYMSLNKPNKAKNICNPGFMLYFLRQFQSLLLIFQGMIQLASVDMNNNN